MEIFTVFSRATLRPLRVITTTGGASLRMGEGELTLPGNLWPDFVLVVTQDDMGDEVLFARPAPPAPPLPREGYEYALDEQTWQWDERVTLAGAQAAKWTEIKQARAAAQEAPLAFLGHVFDADKESREKVMGTLQLASLAPEGWTLVWTTADNTEVEMTKEMLAGLGMSLGAQVSAAHTRSRLLWTRIQGAISVSEIESIEWDETPTTLA